MHPFSFPGSTDTLPTLAPMREQDRAGVFEVLESGKR